MRLPVLVLVVGCGAGGPDTPRDPADAVAAPRLPTAEPVPAELPTVVARVNTHTITSDELERAVRSAEIQAGQALPTQFRDQVYRSVLDRLVSFHLLLQESETRRISVDDAAVDARVDAVRSSFLSNAAFEAQLDDWGTALETLREETRRDLLVEHVLASEVRPPEVDVETARDFYEQHAGQCTEGGEVRARHILIGVNPDAPDRETTVARERAERVRREATGGADFAELARTHSDDPGSAANGGDLGVVAPGQTVPDFEAGVVRARPG